MHRVAGHRRTAPRTPPDGSAGEPDLLDVEGAVEAALVVLHAGRHDGVRVYRREMLYAMCAALRSKAAGNVDTLAEGVWQAQNRIRHAGRKFGKYNVGSTLLVKGLEFDHAVIAETSQFDRKDWYVALTRAAARVHIVSASKQLLA